MKLATNDQMVIPGLEEYENRINELRSKGAVLLVEIGKHLSEARVQFSNHPQQYWEDWLRIKFQMKAKAAEFAIAAWEMMNGTNQVLTESTLRTLVRLSPTARQDIRQRLLNGEVVDRRTITKSIQKSKEIIIGSSVSSEGYFGKVTAIDGEVVMVSIDDAMPTPYFKTELVLETEDQISLRLLKKAKVDSHSSDYQLRMMADELELVKGTLYELWTRREDFPDRLIDWVDSRHPSIEYWCKDA